MIDWAIWLAIAGVLIVAVGIILALRRRRRGAARNDPAAIAKQARQAVREMAKQQRRGRNGTIRGKGSGGSDQIARDAGYGSDMGGGI